MTQMVQFFGAGNREVWVNPSNVTHVEQVGSGQRAKIHFAGGEAFEVEAAAQAVAGKLNTTMRG